MATSAVSSAQIFSFFTRAHCRDTLLQQKNASLLPKVSAIMNLIRRCLSVALIVMSAASHMNDLEAYGFASADYWPTNGWRSTTPEKQGIDSAKLADALDYIRA